MVQIKHPIYPNKQWTSVKLRHIQLSLMYPITKVYKLEINSITYVGPHIILNASFSKYKPFLVTF